jgi:hypothetical protein
MGSRGTVPLYVHGHCELANLHKFATNQLVFDEYGESIFTSKFLQML